MRRHGWLLQLRVKNETFCPSQSLNNHYLSLFIWVNTTALSSSAPVQQAVKRLLRSPKNCTISHRTEWRLMLQGHIHILYYSCSYFVLRPYLRCHWQWSLRCVLQSRSGLCRSPGSHLGTSSPAPGLEGPTGALPTKRRQAHNYWNVLHSFSQNKVAQCLRSKYADIGKGGTGQKAYLSCYI